MRRFSIVTLSFALVATVCFAQDNTQIITFDQIFPRSAQNQMGLHKLTAEEREALTLACADAPHPCTREEPEWGGLCGRGWWALGEGECWQRDIHDT